MDVRLHQALYGYEDGHRQIATSTRLDREAERVLRGITDLKVGGPEHHYLTVAPLPGGVHAFVRTWAAGAGFRPGSVWSHAVFIDHTDMDLVDTFETITEVFRRPRAQSPLDLPHIRDEYRDPIALPSPHARRHPAADHLVAQRIVTAAYADPVGGEVIVSRASDHEHLLIGLLDQGWPALRRATAFRTRHRRTETSAVDFAVELVERPSTRSRRVDVPKEPWVDELARDIESSDAPLREWLRSRGPEAGANRSIVRPLTTIFSLARDGRTDEVVDAISRSFPASSSMKALKFAMVGPRMGPSPVAGWPDDDLQRVRLGLRSPRSFDLEELQMGARLAALASTNEDVVLTLLNVHTLAAIPPPQAVNLAAEIEPALSSYGVSVLAARDERIAQILLVDRPDAWAEEALWRDPMAVSTLQRLLMQADRSDRQRTLVGLASRGAVDEARWLVEREPTLWWALMTREQAPFLIANTIMRQTARALLTESSANVIGAAPMELDTLEQLEALLMVSSPDDRMWRGTDPARWEELVRSPVKSPEVRFSALVLAIATAEGSHDTGTRDRAWRTAFGQLHRQLERSPEHTAFERTLDKALPGPHSWDWCGRLREGLARVAIDAEWSADDVSWAAAQAGDYAMDLAERVRRRAAKKESGLLESLLRAFWQ